MFSSLPPVRSLREGLRRGAAVGFAAGLLLAVLEVAALAARHAVVFDGGDARRFVACMLGLRGGAGVVLGALGGAIVVGINTFFRRRGGSGRRRG